MAFTFGEVRRSLTKKGFKEDTDRDHIYLRFFYNGKRAAVYTKCSHGANKEDIRHGVANAMKRQLKLTQSQLEDFVECTLSEEKYIELLQSSGVLPKPETKK